MANPSKTLTVSLGPADGLIPAAMARAAINDEFVTDISGIFISLDASSGDGATVEFRRFRQLGAEIVTTVETRYIRAMSLTLSYLEA